MPASSTRRQVVQNWGKSKKKKGRFQEQGKVQVNQGETEYYKIRTSALLPRRALRDHNILISLSVFQVNQGSSFWETFAYNSKYDCTLLLVPYFDHGLLQFPSAFHISKRQRHFSPLTVTERHTTVFHTYVLLCGGDFVLYSALCSPLSAFD